MATQADEFEIPGQPRASINRAANYLLAVGLISILIMLANNWLIYTMTPNAFAYYYPGRMTFNIQFSLNFILFFVLAFFLKNQHYKLVRRCTFFTGIGFVIVFYSLLYQLQAIYTNETPWAFLSLKYFSLPGTLVLLLYFIKLFLIISAYCLLTSNKVKSAAQAANVPYEPFMRYSPHRGLLIAFIVAIVLIVNHISVASQNKATLSDILKTNKQGMENMMKIKYPSVADYQYYIDKVYLSTSKDDSKEPLLNWHFFLYSDARLIDAKPVSLALITSKDSVFKRLQKDAKAGDKRAQYALGVTYLFSLGDKVNTKKGIYWLTRSARQGNHSAQTILSRAYQAGVGVKVDLEKADYWRKKAEI